MAWSGVKGFMWGDRAQDIVSTAVGKYLPNRWWLQRPRPVRTRRLAVAKLVRADADVRYRVSRLYMVKWGRQVSTREYNNLISVGLHLAGGSTSPGRKRNKEGR